jgi:hypothetical protein
MELVFVPYRRTDYGCRLSQLQGWAASPDYA